MTTRSFWILCGFFAVILFTGLMTVNNELIALASPLIIYLITAVILAPGGHKLHAHRSLSTDRVSEGMDVEIKIQVENENARIDELHLYELPSEKSKILKKNLIKITQLAPGESIEYEYFLRGERGNYGFDGVLAVVTDPFGMFETREVLPAGGKVLVFPEIIDLKPIPIQPPQTKGFSGPLTSRKSGTGVDFYGVRQYQFGDSLRRINWKASAQHLDRLFTNEFEQERIADVSLILDARSHCDITYQGRSLFEYSIQAAASITSMFLSDGHSLSLLVYGANIAWVFPGYGRVQYERILEALAHAESGTNYETEHLHYFPARLLPPSGQLIYISPLAASDYKPMKRFRDLGYAVLILSPDPLFFESAFEPLPYQPDFLLAKRFAQIERSLLLNNLRQAGIQVADWKVDQPLTEVVDKMRIEFSHLQRRAGVPA